MIFEYMFLFSFVIGIIILFLLPTPEIRQEDKSIDTLDYLMCESPIEKRLYQGLLQHSLYPVTQYRVGRYRIDLAFPKYMLAIECDGKAFHSSPKQKAHDRKRDKFLKSQGWTVLRFSGRKIYRDLPGVVKTVKENLN